MSTLTLADRLIDIAKRACLNKQISTADYLYFISGAERIRALEQTNAAGQGATTTGCTDPQKVAAGIHSDATAAPHSEPQVPASSVVVEPHTPARSEPHEQTDECGFDRDASINERRYVCMCGWRSTAILETVNLILSESPPPQTGDVPLAATPAEPVSPAPSPALGGVSNAELDALVERLQSACIIEQYDDSGLNDEFRGKGHRVWSNIPNEWLYPGDKIISGTFDPQQAASAIVALQQDVDRYRNGFANLMQALQDAPALPIETLSVEDQAKWTDLLTGLLMALGVLETTGKPQSMWEALCDAARGAEKPTCKPQG